MATNSKTPTKTTRAKAPATVGINVQVPVALHRKVRVKGINSDLDLTGAVTAALTAWVK